MMRSSVTLLALFMAFAGLARLSTSVESGEGPESPIQVERADRPFLALWEEDGGRGGHAPSLRFAFWSDGSVLFARDPEQWGHDLQQGKISQTRVARLKAALAESGVFPLKGTCYLVPDASTDCLLVDLGDKKQLLFWDEVEMPNYGINNDPTPTHLEFKRCWKAINRLGLVALPDEGDAVKKPIQIPRSWMIKEAIQSE